MNANVASPKRKRKQKSQLGRVAKLGLCFLVLAPIWLPHRDVLMQLPVAVVVAISFIPHMGDVDTGYHHAMVREAAEIRAEIGLIDHIDEITNGGHDSIQAGADDAGLAGQVDDPCLLEQRAGAGARNAAEAYEVTCNLLAPDIKIDKAATSLAAASK